MIHPVCSDGDDELVLASLRAEDWAAGIARAARRNDLAARLANYPSPIVPQSVSRDARRTLVRRI
jgi:hypothetical protein